jgi:hypothetical protein
MPFSSVFLSAFTMQRFFPYISYKLGLRDNLTDVIEQLAFQFNSEQYTANGEYQVRPVRSAAQRSLPLRKEPTTHTPPLHRTTLAAVAHATPCLTTPFPANIF